MKRRVRWQTKNCIRCNRPAKIWGGAVRMGRQWVLAGWCKRCKYASYWFKGDYKPSMGKEPA
jgi:hypothetical protein